MKKLLKILGIGIGVLVLAWAIGNTLTDANLKVERNISIDAPAPVVFNQVNDLRKWEAWSPWRTADSTMVITYGDSYKGEGSSYSWESLHSGTGKLVIQSSDAPNKLETLLFFGESTDTSFNNFTFSEENGTTNVRWEFSAYFPWHKRLLTLVFKPVLGEQFKEGLQMMKTVSEAAPPILIEEVETEEMIYVGIREEVQMEEVSDAMGRLYGKIMEKIIMDSVGVAGQPFAIWHGDGENTFDMECGIPVEAPVKDGSTVILNKTLPAGKQLSAVHIGPYSTINETYEILRTEMNKLGLEENGPQWEVYLTDPGYEPDSTKWETRIYFPVK